MRVQTLVLVCVLAAVASSAAAQSPVYHARKARKHFVSVSYDWLYIQPYGFAKHPLSDLLGQPVSEVHLQTFQYQTRDQLTQVHVNEFSHNGQGLGLTLYPFGASDGPTLLIRGSVEQLPTIRLAFDGPAPAPTYELTSGRGLDVGIGIDVSDRAPGWGLGSHAFVLGGVGRALTDQMNGSRYFGEGGGGVSVGPFGVDISVKFAVNRFATPVTHRLYDLPIAVRGTLTF
jgi:hypothetical protein